MKKFIFLLSLHWAIITGVSAQNITRLEYSLDEFVAEGKGTELSIAGNTGEINNDFNIDISTLAPGTHTIYVRAQNENGQWSFAAERSFIIPAPEITDGIIAFEYFFDSFVKPGGGTLVSPETPTNEYENTISVDISGLNAGTHTIYLRAKNKLGLWSHASARNFIIANPDTAKIEKIYYRFFNNTYTGEWMASMVAPPEQMVDSTIRLNASGLDFGQDYTIEFFGMNTRQERGLSAFLSGFDLRANHPPVGDVDTLELKMITGETLSLSLDTLFTDEDLVFGDTLQFSNVGMEASGLDMFTTVTNDTLFTFAPSSGQDGDYALWTYSKDMAGDRDSILINLIVSIPTAVSPELSDGNLIVYPNPVSENLTIQFESASFSSYLLKLYSQTGQLLKVEDVEQPVYQLNMKQYPTGIYIVTLWNQEISVTKKIIRK